jgi:ComF family protein
MGSNPAVRARKTGPFVRGGERCWARPGPARHQPARPGKGCSVGPPGSVNLSSPCKSTIAGTSLGPWLRRRSTGLPWRWRLSFWALPPTCLLCGLAGDLGAVDLCSHCLAELPWLAGLEAGVDAGVDALADAGNAANLPGVAAGVPFAYAAPLDRALPALKFRGDRRPAAVFGALLAAWCARREAREDGPLPERLVPIPLHRTRLRERGFNQATALARHAGRWLGVPVDVALLERVRATRPQTELTARERQENMIGAFQVVAGGRAPAPRHVALVDDVLTTGATAAAAAAALRAAGVERVEVWAVAQALLSESRARTARGSVNAP